MLSTTVSIYFLFAEKAKFAADEDLSKDKDGKVKVEDPLGMTFLYKTPNVTFDHC